MKSTAVVLLLAALLCGGAVTGFRLSTDILPIRYTLELTPYLTNPPAGKTLFTFDGVADIMLQTTQSTLSQIVLHSKGLNMTATPQLVGTDNIINGTRLNTTTDKLTLQLTYPLVANVIYTLRFVYTGPLNADMYGFYRSSYTQNNETKWAATTQMQATHARRVFPCFDEPAFKARFDIIIQRPANFSPSFSNTRIRSSTAVGTTLMREVFDTTPPMSTYLLAFIVSEFRVRETEDGSFGVIARPDAYEQTLYAFEVGPKLLSAMDKWTGYNYSSVDGITKMQMAALPDFSAGAMENWGLLTYRETALLYSEEDSTALAKQRVASVITHEQAHMWFGDLVTCDWWSYTWLNEGFARFFQYFGTAFVENTWALDQQFVVEQLHTALAYDSAERARALSHDVNTPAEISGIFDSISYNKGASVLRMIEHVIGQENFKLAVQTYLKENEFNTSTPAKLYRALQRQSGLVNIVDLMDPWTTQAGYPVVHVERVNGTTNQLAIKQERFYLKQRVLAENDKELWDIPLSYALSNGDNQQFHATGPRVTFSKKQATVNVSEGADWVLFNVQQTGYYRVNYESAIWTNISAALKANNQSSIHVLNRAQIVDDVLNLARAEYVNYTLALDAVQYLEEESHYIPWLAALNNLAYVYRRIEAKDLDVYKKFMINLSEHAYKQLTFNASKATDSQLDIYNRANILSHRCKYGNEECVKAAQAEFNQLLANDKHMVPVNVRSVVYCTAIAQGNQTVWDLFWNRFRNANVAAEQVLILNALGCTKNNVTLIGYLDRILGDGVRLQDKASAFAATYNEQAENVQTVLDYVLANHERIAQAFGSTSNVAGILSNVAARFTTDAQIEQLKTFRTATAAYTASASLQTAIDDAEFNQRWAKKHVPVIVDYMRKKNGAGALTSAVVMVVVAAMFAIFY